MHHARTGDGVGQGPVADDQDADTGDKPLGQKGTRPAPGPGGGADVVREGQPDTRPVTPADVAAEKAREEKAAFEQAAQQIRDAVRSDPALADLVKQLAIDMTPEGLRIQILDEVKLPMFPTGSSTPNERARLLMQKIVPVLMKLSQPISIAGHTDAAPFPGPDRTNWELSAERANATRRLLVDGGFPRNAGQVGDRGRGSRPAAAGRSAGRGKSADRHSGAARGATQPCRRFRGDGAALPAPSRCSPRLCLELLLTFPSPPNPEFGSC